MANDSTFGAPPERLRRLLMFGRDESDEHEKPTASWDILNEKPGSQIGRYRLVRLIGEGGMGMVYLAQQEHPIKRQVALKVIKPGMDSKRVMTRFETERQALALLDHPNIAHVYDAGTTEAGRPYFVMERVKGLPITEHCDHHKLTIEERLRLFQQVCEAVQHAHQKGIIHRDIKPSNILISMENDRSIPKIIDFGIAKALAQPLTERTVATEESQLLGTPEYMSPEQADPASLDMDTRSDVYSLGVLLYVLLTGALPFDSDTLREGGIEHVRKMIRETDPKTPSKRLPKLGDKATAIAKNRRMEIHTLARHLRNELEWIPLKAMRKERTERYRSASELADDIENYLKGAPLIAGPESTMYLIGKFVRRKRGLVAAVVAILAVLVAGVVVATVFAIRAEHARSEAQLIADFLENDVLGSVETAKVGEATVSYTLNSASKSLEGKFKDKPLTEASIRYKLGYVWREIGETNEAEQQFLKAIDLYKQHYGEKHRITLQAMDYLGYIYEDQGRYRDMERLYTGILKSRSCAYGLLNSAGTMNGLGVALCHLAKYKDAESWFNKALQLEKACYEREGRGSKLFPYIRCNLARVYTATGQYGEAEQLLRKNIETTGADAAEIDNKYLKDLRYSTELAGVYRERGRYNKAEPLFERTLKALCDIKGDEHFLTILCMYGLVQLYVDQDRYEEAEKLFSEALPIARHRLRKDHPVTLQLVNAFAVLRTKQKQYNEAERLFDETLKGRQRELGDDHPYTLESKNDLAMLYKEQGDYAKVEPLLVKALEGRRIKLGDTHPHTLESWNNLIALYEAWNKPEKASEWRDKLSQTEAVDE
jgi:tetratricopeptide (TPR) repeat protein/tRNA A-37 threonylcarbamoyl transferase component Bud32